MISAGLHLNDLNLFDSTSDLLITAMQQERAIEDAIEKVKLLFSLPLKDVPLNRSNKCGSDNRKRRKII